MHISRRSELVEDRLDVSFSACDGLFHYALAVSKGSIAL